jgi:hypothetical protein
MGCIDRDFNHHPYPAAPFALLAELVDFFRTA